MARVFAEILEEYGISEKVKSVEKMTRK